MPAREFISIFLVSWDMLMIATLSPPAGCVEIPYSCFAKRGPMGHPGPLGYDLKELHAGWPAAKLENYANENRIPLYGRRYHEDGRRLVLPIVKLLADAETAKGRKNNRVVSQETRNSRKRPLASASTFLIKGLGK
jgi:hypothetical protein